MAKRRKKRKKKPEPIKEKNPILFRTICPICDTFNSFFVRESLGVKKQHYARCEHCALMLFGQDAIYTYLRKMRYSLKFEAGTREDLNDLFNKTLDLRRKKHPVYFGALQKKSLETRRRLNAIKKLEKATSVKVNQTNKKEQQKKNVNG